MKYKISNRMSGLKPSAIREILKVTQDPTVISFAAGNPAPETFPANEMAEIAANIFKNDAASALQYGMTEGYPKLRNLTFDRLKNKYNIGKDTDDILITSGGQQAIELASKVLLNEGDVLICEDPSFIGALNAFRSFGTKLIGCPTDEFGMKMDCLEELLKNTENVKMIYTIPTFQNPSGKTLPVDRRQKMLELADKYNVIILEDDPYFELRYSGEFVPSIKSFDDKGIVIYCGSYSKIISPGIRIGFAIAQKELLGKMVVSKQTSDVHTNLFFQMVVAQYLEKHDIDAHIAQNRKIYAHKRDIMLSEIDKNFDKRITVTRPDGGLFLWVQLPKGCDGFTLCKRAGAKKVAAVPGVTFSADEEIVSPGIRLNFSLPTDEQIKIGIKILSDTINEYLGEK